MAQTTQPLTEEKVLEVLRAEGITNLRELAQKAVEEANSKSETGVTDVNVLIHSGYILVGGI